MKFTPLISISFIVAFLFAGGCATPQIDFRKPDANTTSELVARNTQRETDEYRKTSKLVGPKSSWNSTSSGPYYEWLSYWMLRGNLDDSGSLSKTCQVYFRLSASDWYFLSETHDSDGTGLQTIEIDREVVSGTAIAEDVGVIVTTEYLLKHRNSGFRIRIDGKRGYVEIAVPAYYVDGFLKAGNR